MFTAILAIAAVLIVGSAIIYFVITYGQQIADLWSWALHAFQSILGSFPSWVLTFVVIGLVLAVVALLVKLL